MAGAGAQVGHDRNFDQDVSPGAVATRPASRVARPTMHPRRPRRPVSRKEAQQCRPWQGGLLSRHGRTAAGVDKGRPSIRISAPDGACPIWHRAPEEPPSETSARDFPSAHNRTTLCPALDLICSFISPSPLSFNSHHPVATPYLQSVVRALVVRAVLLTPVLVLVTQTPTPTNQLYHREFPRVRRVPSAC